MSNDASRSAHGFFGVTLALREVLVAHAVDEGWSAARARRSVGACLAKCRSGCTWSWLEDCQTMWTDLPVCERQLRRDFHDLAVCFERSLADPALRMQQSMPGWPRCTAIVDGTLVPCRLRKTVADGHDGDSDEEIPVRRRRDMNCSRKKAGHSTIGMVVEWWCTLEGVPFFLRGPFPGSQHDARSFLVGGSDAATATMSDPLLQDRNATWLKKQLFPHYKTEVFLGDKGYIGCQHVMTDYKKPRGGRLDDEQRHFNRLFRVVRSRIERLFAFMDRFHIMHFCDGDAQHLRDVCVFLTGVFYVLYMKNPQYNDTQPCNPRELFGELQQCRYFIGNEVVPDTSELRDALKNECGDVVYEPKKSRKRAR